MRRLLVITQVMDPQHFVLGFFANWVKAWVPKLGALRVIALQTDPQLTLEGVQLISLGKEVGSTKLQRIFRFYKTVWQDRHLYDDVFVHMNEEYVILCGLLWRLMGKRVYLWRNHPIGTWMTPIAARLAQVLFYTSPQSFVARYAKAVQMPAGITVPTEIPTKIPGTIIMAGRIAEWYKRTHLLVEAGITLKQQRLSESFRISILGAPDKGEEAYYQDLQERVQAAQASEVIHFAPGVSHEEVLRLYGDSDIVVNVTQSGSFDKSLLEAMAQGALPLTSNKALVGQIPEACIVKEDSSDSLAVGIKRFLQADDDQKLVWREEVRAYIVENHSFDSLTAKLSEYLRREK